MKTFFSYHGSKYQLAKHYNRPTHPVVIEPFAGSAGYSTYWNVEKAILVEKNPAVAGIWRWLIQASADDIMDIPLDISHVDELKGFPQAVKDLVGFWFGRGNAAPSRHLSPANKHNRDSDNTRGRSFWSIHTQRRLVAQIDGINNWEIIEGEYSDAPDIEAHWHIDPPYQTLGKAYKYKAIDYGELAMWCRSRQGRGEVCEGGDADWLPFKVLKDIINQRNAGYRELVYWIGPDESPLFMDE